LDSHESTVAALALNRADLGGRFVECFPCPYDEYAQEKDRLARAPPPGDADIGGGHHDYGRDSYGSVPGYGGPPHGGGGRPGGAGGGGYGGGARYGGRGF